MNEKFPISSKGFERLQQEIKQLKHEERPKATQAVATAREYGDLSENAEYDAARHQQSLVEGRILELESKAARAEVIDINKLSGDVIKFGAVVELLDDETEKQITYRIIGEYEADITQKRISIVSPLARALIGKKVGDIVEVTTPKGLKSYEVISVNYQDFEY